MADDDAKSLFRRRSEGDYDEVHKVAFTKWINKWLEKDGDRVEDLYTDLTDGTKLLTLLRLFTGVKLPCEKEKERIHKIQNNSRVLQYINDVRQIKTDGITVIDLVDGIPKSILGLVWKIILNFDSIETKKDLLEWVQRVTREYEGVVVKDFTHSWKNGRAFCAIISKHRPNLLDYYSCDFSEPLHCLERAFSIAEDELNITQLIEPKYVCMCDPVPENLIMMYVSALKKIFNEMDSAVPEPSPAAPVAVEPLVASKRYLADYNLLLKWISSRQDQLASHGFPKTSEEAQKLLDRLRHQQRAEEKEKEKRMKELGVMEQELTEFQRRYGREIHFPKLTELEKKWSHYRSASDSYKSALEKLLQKQTEFDQKQQRKGKRLNDKQQGAAVEIQTQIQAQIDKCRCHSPFRIVRVSDREDTYKFGCSDKKYKVRILRKTVMVRVGGGWEPLEKFLSKHDPCRKTKSSTHQYKIRFTNRLLDREKVDIRTDQQKSRARSRDSEQKLLQPSSPISNGSLTGQKALPPKPDDSEQSYPLSINQEEALKQTASRTSTMDSRLKLLHRCNVTLQEVQSLYGTHQIILVLSRGSRIPIPTRLLHDDYY